MFAREIRQGKKQQRIVEAHNRAHYTTSNGGDNMNTCKMKLHRFSQDMVDFYIAEFCEGVRLDGRVGKWHGIDFACLSNYAETCHYAIALFEHDTFGDEAALILAFYDRYSNRMIELAETFDNIETALIDEDIV